MIFKGRVLLFSNYFAKFVEIFDCTRKCLSFSLMNLGNSFTVREDEPCCLSVYTYGICVHQRRLLFFSSYQVFLGPISGD